MKALLFGGFFVYINKMNLRLRLRNRVVDIYMIMKKTLLEQISRIKEMMDINEKEIDFTNYKFVDEDDPIKEMKLIDFEEENQYKRIIVLLKIRTYVSNQELVDKGDSFKGLWGGAKGRQMVFDCYLTFGSGGKLHEVLKIEPEKGTDTTGFSENYLNYWSNLIKEWIFRKGFDVRQTMYRIYEGYFKMIEGEPTDVKMGVMNKMKKNIRLLEHMIGDAFLTPEDRLKWKLEEPKLEPHLKPEIGKGPEIKYEPKIEKEPEIKDEPKIDDTPEKNNNMWISTNSWASE